MAPIGIEVEKGQILYIIYAESNGELDYALKYYNSQTDILTIE
jgi:thymidine phosphorylase